MLLGQGGSRANGAGFSHVTEQNVVTCYVARGCYILRRKRMFVRFAAALSFGLLACLRCTRKPSLIETHVSGIQEKQVLIETLVQEQTNVHFLSRHVLSAVRDIAALIETHVEAHANKYSSDQGTCYKHTRKASAYRDTCSSAFEHPVLIETRSFRRTRNRSSY